MALGALFGIVEHTLDLEALHAPKVVVILDDALVFCLPAALGALAGVVWNAMRRQTRVNRALSTENAKLQRGVFAQLLSSHLLHEIRNPLHNLAAAVERWKDHWSPEQAAVLHRNLDRLDAVTKELTRWGALGEAMHLRETVPLRPWLQEFIQDKVRPQLHQANITCELAIDPMVVYMHPLLLEQCFITLFNNAVEAVIQANGMRAIHLAARGAPNQPNWVDIQLRNSGARYPDDVIAKQGRALAESPRGLGLGLVLVRRTVQQVGGSMHLANTDGQSTVTLRIPGRHA